MFVFCSFGDVAFRAPTFRCQVQQMKWCVSSKPARALCSLRVRFRRTHPCLLFVFFSLAISQRHFCSLFRAVMCACSGYSSRVFRRETSTANDDAVGCSCIRDDVSANIGARSQQLRKRDRERNTLRGLYKQRVDVVTIWTTKPSVRRSERKNMCVC